MQRPPAATRLIGAVGRILESRVVSRSPTKNRSEARVAAGFQAEIEYTEREEAEVIWTLIVKDTKMQSRRAMPAQGLLLLALLAVTAAGPLPYPNSTSSDVGLKEGSCALGDVVYKPGDEFPGSGPCEKCTCSDGGVKCAQQRCEPRPGCKALHRPDHCCPTYQCECEQEGRVYGNGEKLVDPADPCRVCYCQGGEVVCRRIACFVRDDCTPRLVPGRCCPEYENCPLRGVTTLPGMAVSPASVSTSGEIEASAEPSSLKENIKQEITIKEITPVSEIPIITEVKIKEILPSPSIEVSEYSSSKSPLIPREATSEKNLKKDGDSKTESPAVVEIHSTPSTEEPSPEVAKTTGTIVVKGDDPPSKISFSTQDSINSEIYPSIIPSIATMGSPAVTPESVIDVATKAPILEEEDPALLDHNPAFPPLPDDLSVLSNHGDEIVPETSADNDHISIESTHVSSNTLLTEVKQPHTTTSQAVSVTTVTNNKISETTLEPTTVKIEVLTSTERTTDKENPTVNLRSAIPTEILGASSYVPEKNTRDQNITAAPDTLITSAMTTAEPPKIEVVTSTTTEEPKTKEINKDKLYISTEKLEVFTERSVTTVLELITSTQKVTETQELEPSTKDVQEPATSSIAKTNIATEVTSHTELSSLPVETSDQKPHEVAEPIIKSKSTTITEDPFTTKMSSNTEVITVSKATSANSFEEETTEFILTSFASSETATDNVELIKIAGDSEKNAPIIENTHGRKNAVLTELINLVSDVASMNDNDNITSSKPPVTASSISESEELIPVNAGYKSKNNNRNVNSITEIPPKSKNQAPTNRQKVVEIEDDDSDNITDSPPPNDRVEPTTRRPIIDNVSDDMPMNKTEKKDIDIITQGYVPTVERRPTKVIMKKNNEKPKSEEKGVSASLELGTEETNVSDESATTAPPVTEAVAKRIVESLNTTSGGLQ